MGPIVASAKCDYSITSKINMNYKRFLDDEGFSDSPRRDMPVGSRLGTSRIHAVL